jgi:hypothetical protein
MTEEKGKVSVCKTKEQVHLIVLVNSLSEKDEKVDVCGSSCT